MSMEIRSRVGRICSNLGEKVHPAPTASEAMAGDEQEAGRKSAIANNRHKHPENPPGKQHEQRRARTNPQQDCGIVAWPPTAPSRHQSA